MKHDDVLSRVPSKCDETSESVGVARGFFLPDRMIPGAMPRDRRSIYVQIDIAGTLDRTWELTQTPELHQRWDLRFTEIRYLPRADPAEPQRFLYATRIGFGLRIRGEGESVGTRDGPAVI